MPPQLQLACGSDGYLPTEKAEKGSHYSAYVSSGVTGHEGGELLVRKTIEEINKINPNGKIIIHGLSMGGGITLFLSNKNMENVKCLIADAPSISIKKFFKNVSGYAFKSKNEVICSHLYKRFNKEFNVVIYIW